MTIQDKLNKIAKSYKILLKQAQSEESVETILADAYNLLGFKKNMWPNVPLVKVKMQGGYYYVVVNMHNVLKKVFELIQNAVTDYVVGTKNRYDLAGKIRVIPVGQ